MHERQHQLRALHLRRRPMPSRVLFLVFSSARISPGKVGANCHAPLYLKSHQLWAQDFIFDYLERMREPV
jgi:hypothetical protein